MESAKKTDLANLMWSEKYRPKKLSEVVDQKEIIKGISNLIKSPDIPHMLFAGPAGVGKTTTALCIAMELLGEEWRKNTLELNASDERGIKMVRERVKEFAASIKLAGDKEFGKPKIIILDESARTTRFVIICNYLSQIIEPIQSRCVVFRFTRLPKEDVIDHLKMICEQ